MDSNLNKRLQSVRGSLSALATKDEAARRRWPDHADKDGLTNGFGSPYAVDRRKIMSSEGIARESGRTQVQVMPSNKHVRDRLRHSLEVAATAEEIADVLGLNRDLCGAIGLGHDLGHPPFGHLTEKLLSDVLGQGQQFRHEVFGLIVAQQVERGGEGLNLTQQTLSGMLNHSRGAGDLTTDNLEPEAGAAMFADKLTYVFADFDDLFTRRNDDATVSIADHPELAKSMAWFGADKYARIHRCVAALCVESAVKGRVSFDTCEEAVRFREVKRLMYEVYSRLNPTGSLKILSAVYDALADIEPNVNTVVAFALMNDDDVIRLATKLSRGQRLQADDLSVLSIGDMIHHLRGRNFDVTNPDLNW